MNKFIFLFLFISGFLSFAEDTKIMNDIQLNDYIGFEKKWHFVTVRHRKDTGELRLTYANELAWSQLQNQSRNYADGSVFAKISYQTQLDEAFPNSSIPNEQRRIQFMVKDKVKYAKTQGWGYALFDPSGNTYKGDHNQQSLACAACHQLVPERGFVFSQPIPVPFGDAHIHSGINWKKKVSFKQIDIKKYAPLFAAQLPPQIKFVRILTGPLSKASFFGTLDEIRPLLIEDVKQHQLPSALITDDKKQISIVYPEVNKSCNDKSQLSLTAIHSLANTPPTFHKISICEKK